MIALEPPVGVERRVLDSPRGALVASYARPPAAHDTGVSVVLVPGYGGSKAAFWPLLPLLAQAGYHGWSYDQLGQRESRGPDDPDAYTIDLLAEDLLSVVAQVDGGAPVHLVGHCMAGFVARASTVARPAAVRSLTLFGCGPSIQERQRKALVALDAKLDDGVLEAFWPAVERLLSGQDPRTVQLCHDRMQTVNHAFLRGAARALGAERDRSADLRATGVPVLVLHGAEDRALWTADAFADMAAELDAVLAIVDDTAHRPHVEAPEPTFEALLGFWSRVSGRSGAVCSRPGR